MIAFADPLRSILELEPRIRAYLARRVPQADVDDATQAVLVKAWRGGFDPTRSSLSTWLHTIARRVVIDAARKRNCRPHSCGGTEWQADHREQSPDAALTVKDDVAALLASLRPRDAELLRLHHLDGLGYDAIAIQLGIPRGTVASRMNSVLGKIRRGK